MMPRAARRSRASSTSSTSTASPCTVIDTVVSVCGKVPRPSVVYVLHGEEHRLRVGEPQAGLHAAHHRDRQEGAVLMAAQRPNQAGGTAIGGGGSVPHPPHRRAARRQDRRGAADPRAHERDDRPVDEEHLLDPGRGAAARVHAVRDRGGQVLPALPRQDGRPLSDGSGQVNTLDALKQGNAARSRPATTGRCRSPTARAASCRSATSRSCSSSSPSRRVQPKPMLPASVRGTFADRFDPRLMRDPRRVSIIVALRAS